MKRIDFLALGLSALPMAATLTSGCGKSEKTNDRKYLVVFSQCNNAEPYRAAQNALLENICAEYEDIQLEIMDAQQQNQNQIAQIETAITKQPDLLIVAPNERGPLTKIMGQAMDAGIPTICLERDILEPNYTTYIKCDNYEIGRMAGQFIADHLKAKYGQVKGKIVDLRGLLGVEGEINRHNGARSVLEQYDDVEFVQEAVADWLQSRARERMTEILSAQEQIDVVYGHNDPMAIGAYLAAKEVGREKEMIFVGVDGLGSEGGGIAKVMSGVLAATFIYPLCIDKAMEIGNQILRTPDFKPDKEYIMPSQIVTPENAEELYQKVTLQ